MSDDREQSPGWCFTRQELAGSLGDLGTLLPLAIGLIRINGLEPTAVLLAVGLFYVLTGLYFRTTVPVQPMKAIGAYAIAMALTPVQISTAGLMVGAIMLVLGLTGLIDLAGRLVPRPVVRGVQLTTGVLLFVQGIRFMLGQTVLQQAQGAAEPFLTVQSLGPVPIGVVLGGAAVMMIMLLLDNRVIPAALVVVIGGVAAGLVLGGYRQLDGGVHIGLHLPAILPYGWPASADLTVAILVLALPQLPMTVGNAVVAQADLAREYFGEQGRRSTHRALALSMGLANVLGALVGAMPMCHGAGGLAAHYRFGARTPGSNLMIGGLFLAGFLLVGDEAAQLLGLLPLAVLGALLVFAGCQLAMMILDVKDRRDLFVVIVILGIALTTNLAWGFGVGIALAYALQGERLKV